MRYVKDSQARLPAKGEFQKQLSRTEPFLKIDSRVTAARIPPPYMEPEQVKSYKQKIPQPNRLSASNVKKPVFNSPQASAIKKKIILPPIEMARIDNPSYINYYQIVREKIRRSAYQNYSHNSTGEVYVSFVISNDGYVKDVRLVEEKTNATSYLKEIALKSVKSASPFPDFPKELDYPQLSFNIIISFEIE